MSAKNALHALRKHTNHSAGPSNEELKAELVNAREQLLKFKIVLSNANSQLAASVEHHSNITHKISLDQRYFMPLILFLSIFFYVTM